MLQQVAGTDRREVVTCSILNEIALLPMAQDIRSSRETVETTQINSMAELSRCLLANREQFAGGCRRSLSNYQEVELWNKLEELLHVCNDILVHRGEPRVESINGGERSVEGPPDHELRGSGPTACAPFQWTVQTIVLLVMSTIAVLGLIVGTVGMFVNKPKSVK